MSDISLKIPEGAAMLLDRLTAAGFKAYVVGGCVRDSLMGREPKDWDICTSASPAEMQQVFQGLHVIETGLKHGTLTVMLSHVPYEVTTFRVDGAYTDHRHPDEVAFVQEVREDLARRDFTINAMAYNPAEGLVDLFGGQEDLEKGIIRCVGEPFQRFDEDALRILRACRFAARFGFHIDFRTAVAMVKLKATLHRVAGERIRKEMAEIVTAPHCGDVLRKYREVFGEIFPVLKPMFGYDQKCSSHYFELWEHTVRAVENVPPQEDMRMAMLFHDIGKPATQTFDEEGDAHFYGHDAMSGVMLRPALEFLKMDTRTRDRIITLVEHHGLNLTQTKPNFRKQLNTYGEEAFRQLLWMRQADNIATGSHHPASAAAIIDKARALLDELLREGSCCSLKNLAVTGRDLLEAGIPGGERMGACLQYLLGEVMEDRLSNTKEALLPAALRWYGESD